MKVKKKLKKHFAEKSHSVFKGFKGGPFEYTKTFFRKMLLIFFLQHSLKMHLLPIQDFFHKNMHIIKIKIKFDCKVFKLQRFSKVFPNVGGNPLFLRGH